MENEKNKKTYSYEYPRPLITVDAIIRYYDEVLLIRRKNIPYQNCWALPGGYLEMDESIENAAYRELEEETGLSKTNGIDELKFSNYLDGLYRDPRGRTISMVFVGNCTDKNLVVAGDDAKEFKWFNINNLPNMAFDHEFAISKVVK